MPNRLLLRAANSQRLEAFATGNRLTRPLVHRYVAGYTVEEAWKAAEELKRDGIDVSLDLLGESVDDIKETEAAMQEYRAAMEDLGKVSPGATIAIKLSQLGVFINTEQCAQNLEELLRAGEHYDVGIEVDMEHSSAGRPTLEIFRQLLAQFPKARQAFQAYMRSTLADLMSFKDIKPRIRLVKGAFDEPASVAIQDADEVTQQYKYLSRWALENLPDPAFGTHDDQCIDYVKQVANELGLGREDFEFQMLYGIRRELQQELVNQGYRVRVYLPYGDRWYPYLMRRMAERPANLLLFLRSLVGG
ncbi:MAG TPA: proline dehydrogenase family protein [Candidatus Yaniella excrementigallinarum]|nr:proline dehydrogenase family protein [Candidatus Yaniella excrementigallinarum]